VIRLLVWSLLAVPAVPVPAPAQPPGTRAETLKRSREEKSTRLTPPQPTFLERVLIRQENDRLLERVLSPGSGLYPRFGSITAGSGLSVGPGYGAPELFGGRAEFRAWAAASFRKYWLLDARLTLPRLAGGAVFADVGAQRYDYPSEDFFGLGPDSARDDHVTYGLLNFVVGGGGGVKPAGWLSLGAHVDWMTPRVSGGERGRSIFEVFDPSEVPGLDRQPDFVRYDSYVRVDYATPPGNPRRGGRYVMSFQRFEDRDFDRDTFNRVEADLQQFISLLRERRVLVLRAHVSLSEATGPGEVPFYLQRTLGGPDDLRGFRRFRFRDTNILLFQVEYRWEVQSAVDAAIFYDAGSVASRREDLDVRHLESDYGFGVRFGTINGIFLRLEGAFGSRGGKHLVLRIGDVF